MHLKNIFRMTVAVGTLTLMGAGCGATDVAVPAPQANGDSAIALRAENLQRMPPAEIVASSQPAEADAPPSVAASRPTSFPGILPAARISRKQVRMATDKGEIVFELFDQDAPKAVSNFVALAESGYYDGLTFHRSEPGFVSRGGDPEGTGRGGPGYRFEDEPVTRDYEAGTVAMANAGPDTNGSQFFICLDDVPTLPKNYTIFGKVTKGMDAVLAIRVGDKMNKVTVEAEK